MIPMSDLNAPAPVRQSVRTFSLIIPVHFNADSLPFLFVELGKFEAALSERGLDLELIFVDDGSGDDSFVRLIEFRRTRPGTKVIELSRNFGAPAAVKAGMRFVAGDCFISFAADLEEPLEQVLLMAEQWTGGHNLVLSTRRSAKIRWQLGRSRRPIGRSFASQ